MKRLSNIPGLHFLQIWVTSQRATRTAIGQRVGDLQAYHGMARQGVDIVKGRTAEEGGAGGDPDDYEGDGEGYSTDDYGDDGYSDDDLVY
mgnify:CR=1 FL=1